ncbi:phosphatase PAP2 family protein [Labilibacter marinus]|uniref:phosphatase PAP2 family protein n=1 Tax=Labilibacter marinus TaxID=1477105 RepID=UPI00094F86B8|nr:phosphatase PAP2 family protein [Labilibacter marinus]
MDALLQFDTQLFQLINFFHSKYEDNAFWLISSTIIWVPMYLVIIYTFIKSQKLQSWITIVAVLLLIVLCDRISTDIFKYGFERLRPSHDPDLMGIVKNVFGYKGGKFGFVSSHATNTMGIAVFTSLIFRNKVFSIFILIWSLVVGYSRIYLGVHFPGDVLGGFMLGALLGYLVYKLYALVIPRFVRLTYFNRKGLRRGIAEQFEQGAVYQIVFTGVVSFILILLAAKVMLV